MHKKIFKYTLLFLYVLDFSLATQNSVEATTVTPKVVRISSGPAGGFVRPPQVVLSLDQAAQSLKVAGSGGGKFMLADTNGDGRADSTILVPQGATEAISLDQAISILKGLGGASKSYMAVDINGDGKTDAIIAVTY